MAVSDILQIIADASVDARSLSEFVFKPADFMVKRRLGGDIHTLKHYLDNFDETKTIISAYVATIPTIVNDAINNTAVEGGVLADTFVTMTKKGEGTVARNLRDVNADKIVLADYGITGDYIDDALDAFKLGAASRGSMSGMSLVLPSGIIRVKRSHDLSVTGVRLQANGGRYATRVVVDSAGDYSAGYVLKLAPTTGTTTTAGSGLLDITIDLNEAPAVGLLYQGAYDVSVLERSEVINAHKDYPAAIIEPHPSGTVIQTLKIDTSAFSKKRVGGTGYTVEVRKAQECVIINSKFFGSPSNLAPKGSIPLLLEDCRGIQLIGGGYANSETHCIDIYAKTRNTTHVTIIAPTFESYKSKAIRTRAAAGFTVSRMVVLNERLISPAAGLLEGGNLTFSTLYSVNADIELLSGSTNNTVYTFDASKVIDNGTYNTIIDTPSILNENKHTINRQHSVKTESSPAIHLEVVGKTGGYKFQWAASSSTDSGAGIYTPNGSIPIRFSNNRLGFFGKSPVEQRTSPASTATDTDKINKIILNLEQLGLFVAAV